MPVISTLCQDKHVGIFKVMVFGYKIIFVNGFRWDMQWCGWLRYCATSQKVVDSIPDGVMLIFR